MPIYNFECSKCHKTYEQLTSYDETDEYKDISCPSCGSKKKIKLLSLFSWNFKNPVGTGVWNSDSTGHDYRFKHNLPNVAKQREEAQKASHVGTSPYQEINDLDNDNTWGEVK